MRIDPPHAVRPETVALMMQALGTYLPRPAPPHVPPPRKPLVQAVKPTTHIDEYC